jgi:DNA-binding SARP family transcriptional activator
MVASVKSRRPGIWVCVIGPPRIFVDCREIPDRAWSRKRAKKIFCYLVMRREEGFTCQDLVQAFWPKASLKRSHESLRSALQAIRQTLRREAGVQGPVVRMGEGRCHLDPELKVCLDLEEVDRFLLKISREKDSERQRRLVERALTLFRGAFCEGWDEPWVARMKRRITAERLEFLRSFGKACLKSGRVEESIMCFEKALVLDGLHEETCRDLMTAYARMGMKKDVKEAFEEFKSNLERELGVRPESVTQTLYQCLIRGPRPPTKEVVPKAPRNSGP